MSTYQAKISKANKKSNMENVNSDETTLGDKSSPSLTNPFSKKTGLTHPGQILHQTLNNEPFKRSFILPRSPVRNLGLNSGPENYHKQFYSPQIYLPDKAVEATNVLLQEEYNMTENEQILYNEWKKALDENKQQNIVNSKLSQQMEELKKEMMIIKQHNNVVQKVSGMDTIMQYYTDEDELVKETEWIRVKNRRNLKKIRLNNTPSSPQVHAQQQESVLINKNQQNVIKQFPPSHIVVEGIEKYDEFYDTITQNNSEYCHGMLMDFGNTAMKYKQFLT